MKTRTKALVSAIFAAIIFAASSAGTAAAEDFAVITLRFGEVERVFVDERVAEPDFTVSEELSERRINAPLAEKMSLVEQSLMDGASVKAALLYCFPRLKETVGGFLAAVNRKPVNAEVSFRPYNKSPFTFTKERDGYYLSEERLYFEIYSALRRGSNAVITPEVQVLKSDVTAEQLKKYTALRSSFCTDYSRSTDNRKHNVRLALSRLNGKRIESGEEVSFNQIVGARTPANGFEQAKIILNGEYVDGVGGGVCQASTTVYNAVILADLRVVSARAHSLVPSYVLPSFDAMVNSGGSDLRFVNDTDGPIFIKAYGTESKAVVEIYGEALSYRVERESRIISRTDIPADRTVVDTDNSYGTADIAEGESVRVSYGAAGITSEGYLCYYDGGKLLERRLIRRDIYKPLRGVVAVKQTENPT